MARQECDYYGGVYSTSEVLTGDTWIDGKPIYRKCYSAKNISKTSGFVIDSSLTMSVVSSVISIQFNWGDGSQIIPIDHQTISNTYYLTFPRITSSGLEVVLANRTVTSYDLIIEYTKTTD